MKTKMITIFFSGTDDDDIDGGLNDHLWGLMSKSSNMVRLEPMLLKKVLKMINW